MAKQKKETTDQKTLDLIAAVKTQKAEIARSERPNWKTNCTFAFDEGKAGTAVNLQVESSVPKLIRIGGFLLGQEQNYAEAARRVGVESPPPFLWGNSTVSDWLEDIKTRIGKIQIGEKRKRLELLEERLNKIVSPELRAQMELDAISAELR